MREEKQTRSVGGCFYNYRMLLPYITACFGELLCLGHTLDFTWRREHEASEDASQSL